MSKSKSKKPVSEAKLAANRANALKSTGPKTPEGKARSAANACRHELLALNATLSFESRPLYIARQQAIEATLAPRNEAEQSVVDEYVHLTWNLTRIRAVSTRLLDDACAPGTYLDDSITLLASGFRNLHGEEAHQLLHRYEMRTSRMKTRALDEFVKLREIAEKYPPAAEQTPVLDPIAYTEQSNPILPATPSGPMASGLAASSKTASAHRKPVLEFARAAAAALLFFFLLVLTQQPANAASPVARTESGHSLNSSSNPLIPLPRPAAFHLTTPTTSATSGHVSQNHNINLNNSNPPQLRRPQ